VCSDATGSAVCSTSTTDKLHERVSAPYGVGRHDARGSVPVVTAYILVQTEVGKAARVAEEIVQIEGVQQAEDVTGPTT
jgi:translation elongation factor EF-1beta